MSLKDLGSTLSEFVGVVGKDVKTLLNQSDELDFALATLHGDAYLSVKDEWAWRCKVAEVVGCNPRDVGTSTCTRRIQEQLQTFKLHRMKP